MPKKQIKVGLGWWGFREMPIEDHLRIAEDFGFKTLEFGIGDLVSTLPLKVLESEIEAFQKGAADRGIRLTHATVENDFTVGPEHREAMLERTFQEMTLARQVGADSIRLFAGFRPAAEMTEDAYQWLLHAFREAADHADNLEMAIGIETHGQIQWDEEGAALHTHTVSTHRDWLARLVEDLPDAVGFNYDPGNLKAVEPEDTRYALDLLDSRINYCHLKDWRRKGAGWVACAIGDDDLDYGELLRKMSYDGIYLIEYEPLEDVEDGIRRSLDYLERMGYLLLKT